MVTPEQDKKYQECLRILDEIQHIIAATITLNDPQIMAIEPIILVQELVNQMIMFDTLTTQEQNSAIAANEFEMKKVESKPTKGKGKVTLH